MEQTLTCAQCGARNCKSKTGTFPQFCLTTALGDNLVQEVTARYKADKGDEKIALVAGRLESEFYGRATRVEEMLIFIKRMGYKKVGVAACMGLMNECSLFVRAAEAKGIGLYAVTCKVGAVDKTEVGLGEDEKNVPNQFEAMCNPILQAEALNREGTEFNIIMGLCVGHDSLFIKHSKAPVSYLIVKDRVLCHNPAGALYNTGTFYSRLMGPNLPKGRS
ncbi:MAG: DUF1847 domain-containing protein [Spirochaetaceae bacterium]|jgi:uncharacterized metal-binding protein|nr:DUF1847 domain-containing protein [Spirochaetaceae bacterium]